MLFPHNSSISTNYSSQKCCSETAVEGEGMCFVAQCLSMRCDLSVHTAPRLLAIALDFNFSIKGQNSSFICLCTHCGISPNLMVLALSNPCCDPDPLRTCRPQLAVWWRLAVTPCEFSKPNSRHRTVLMSLWTYGLKCISTGNQSV